MPKKVLMLAGDYAEDYEVMVPYQILLAVNVNVDVVCPDKSAGEYIKTAIHDFEGDQTYSEKPGHLFKLNASFDRINLENYEGLFITGGRAPEYLRLNDRVVEIVKFFMEKSLPVASICHGPQILVAADVLKDRTLSAYPTVKPEIEQSGGTYIKLDSDQSHIDGNLVTAPAWPANGAIMKDFLTLLNVKVSFED